MPGRVTGGNAANVSTIHDLVTPCFLVDKARVLHNIAEVADFARRADTVVRPHVKTHKCPEIARWQMAAGAAGLTVATPWEAEVFARVTPSLFIARSSIGRPALARLTALRRAGAELLVGVDTREGAEALSEAATAAGCALGVRIEIDTGQARCGVRPEAAPELARAISPLPGVTLEGIFTHEGHLYSFDGLEGRHAAAARVAALMAECAETLRRDGHEIASVSVGATPARYETGRHAAVTEIRPGNYVYYDHTQILLGAAREEDCAATVLATVVSIPQKGLVVIDAGRKAVSTDGMARESLGLVVGRPEVQFRGASEEHGMLDWPEHVPLPRMGDLLRVIPHHVCPVANLFDELVVVEGETVLEVLPVEARGYGPVRPMGA